MSRTPRTVDSLRTVFWNANGLKQKRFELLDFAQHHDLDVLLINETHLRAGDEPRLPNYRLYRNDRVHGRGGGTAIYVRSDLLHYALDIPELDHLEATGVAIHTVGQGVIRLFAVYNPPDSLLLEADLEVLLDGRDPAILAGDLNAKHPSWNSRLANRNGRILRDFADVRTVFVDGPVEPTHYGPRGRPDVLDVVVLQDVAMLHQLNVVSELSSDHNPVLMFLGEEAKERDRTVECTTSVSWPAFSDHLGSSMGPIPRIESPDDLEESVGWFSSCITNSIQYATNVSRIKDRRDILPPPVKDLIRRRNRARRRAQRTWNPADKAEANALTEAVRRAVRDHRSETWKEKLESLEANDCSLWRMAKILRSDRSTMPPIHGERGVVHTDAEKAEAFADSLERQCTPNYANADLRHIERVHRGVGLALEDPDHPDLDIIEPASAEEVRGLIRKTKLRKAPGPDGISNGALKALPGKAIAALTGIINASLRLRHFPRSWRRADVVVIPKPGKPRNFPQNYRPISLVSSVGKITEGVVLGRLKRALDEVELIPDFQFGFRPGHSAVQQILRIVEHTTEALNKKQSTGMVLLDVSKAFDKVWHEGLLHKMLNAGIPRPLVRLIASYLQDRTFSVKLNGTRSTERRLEAGVPQGSLLSPTLFNIYASDLPETRLRYTQLAVYADDTAVLASSLLPRVAMTKLQAEVERLEAWFRTWRIEVNAEKSKAIWMTRRRSRRPDGNIVMFGQPIPWCREVKYLGVVLDSSLTWNPHVKEIGNRVRAISAKLYPLMCRRSALSPENKLRLYKVVIRPMMTYAASVWGCSGGPRLKRLQVIQNKILRLVFNAPWFVRNATLHADAQIALIKDFIRESAVKFFDSLENHQNPLLRALEREVDPQARVRQPRTLLLQ